MYDFITPIKDQLEDGFHMHCCMFMSIGRPAETPRFYNIGDKDHDNKRFKISSTQKTDLFFWVEAPDEEYFDTIVYSDLREVWAQIRQWRTQFLLDNYPTINPY